MSPCDEEPVVRCSRFVSQSRPRAAACQDAEWRNGRLVCALTGKSVAATPEGLPSCLAQLFPTPKRQLILDRLPGRAIFFCIVRGGGVGKEEEKERSERLAIVPYNSPAIGGASSFVSSAVGARLGRSVAGRAPCEVRGEAMRLDRSEMDTLPSGVMSSSPPPLEACSRCGPSDHFRQFVPLDAVVGKPARRDRGTRVRHGTSQAARTPKPLARRKLGGLTSSTEDRAPGGYQEGTQQQAIHAVRIEGGS